MTSFEVPKDPPCPVRSSTHPELVGPCSTVLTSPPPSMVTVRGLTFRLSFCRCTLYLRRSRFSPIVSQVLLFYPFTVIVPRYSSTRLSFPFVLSFPVIVVLSVRVLVALDESSPVPPLPDPGVGLSGDLLTPTHCPLPYKVSVRQ